MEDPWKGARIWYIVHDMEPYGTVYLLYSIIVYGPIWYRTFWGTMEGN